MNLEEFPESIKKDIEDQSLAILAEIAEDVVVIGGWAVRALAGENHRRYTLDVDCVASPELLPKIEEKLEPLGLKVEKHGWGLLFHKRYEPPADAPEDAREKARETMLRIEISPPRIAEAETPHYFKFSLENYKKAEISFLLSFLRCPILLLLPDQYSAITTGKPSCSGACRSLSAEPVIGGASRTHSCRTPG